MLLPVLDVGSLYLHVFEVLLLTLLQSLTSMVLSTSRSASVALVRRDPVFVFAAFSQY
jgi:hypothetical protein